MAGWLDSALFQLEAQHKSPWAFGVVHAPPIDPSATDREVERWELARIVATHRSKERTYMEIAAYAA